MVEKMKQTLYSNIILDNLKTTFSNTESALIFDYKNRTITGKQILKSIDIIALDLIGGGIKRNDKVIFLVRPSIESILHFFALLRAGAVVVLVDPEMGRENFISRIEFSKAHFILQDKILGKIEKYSFIKPLLRLFNIWFPDNLPIPTQNRITVKNLEFILQQNITGAIDENIIDANEDMAIIFTSGTVNKPKGVVHSYLSLFNALNIISSEISISKSDFLYASQFYFLLIGLMVSARTYIPKNKTFSPNSFMHVASKFNVTSAFLLPYEGELIYKHCRKNKIILPNSFKTILFGSAPVTKGFLSRFSNICNTALKVYGVYGATEMLPISLVEMEEKINYEGKGDLLGKPTKGVKIKIGDDKEIIVSGSQLFVKYLGDNKNANYFYSGDLGEIDTEGNIILLGRKKDMIIRKGFNIYPTLFEVSISKIPEIIECSIVGVYDDNAEDEKIVLFVVSNTDTLVFKDKLKKLLTTGQYSIDSYAIPDEIIFIENMPRSGRSKKIDKGILQSIARKKLCMQ
jgi:acyl-CoA synthetase (AMP-forming)/AMP-acid ligase II